MGLNKRNTTMNKKFIKMLRNHKSCLRDTFDSETTDKMSYIVRTAEELCLVYADFKCEKCGSEENLTFHHLIGREIKDMTNYWKYITQRHYWANILVLCSDCHREVHGFSDEMLQLAISSIKINKVKKKYGINY